MELNMDLPPARRHGGDGPRLARALGLGPAEMLDLSASLNPFAPDVVRLAAAHLSSLRTYPDATEATALLAEAIDVAHEQLLLTNGGAEAIALLAGEIGGKVREPEFSLHPRSGAPLWRSNPNNPTGRLADGEEAADVWDEAFYALATGRYSAGDPAALAVVGSLTKTFACPGLRLGYVIASPKLIEALHQRQPEWSVSGLALALLPELLAGADLPGWARRIAAQRVELVGLLAAHGLAPQPSDANFVLCANASGLRELLLPHGIAVRDCASFGLAGQARLAVPDDGGLERLARALQAIAP
jgi:histidinol-phosphate/aromatic aminotransferase/cobyric acid decarboxylase-like protein